MVCISMCSFTYLHVDIHSDIIYTATLICMVKMASLYNPIIVYAYNIFDVDIPLTSTFNH